MSETILEKAAGLVDTFDNLVKTEFDKVEAEAVTIEKEVVATVETDVIAPVEKFYEAAEAEVKKVVAAVETYFHPEQASKPVINAVIGNSIVKNPA